MKQIFFHTGRDARNMSLTKLRSNFEKIERDTPRGYEISTELLFRWPTISVVISSQVANGRGKLIFRHGCKQLYITVRHY